MIASSHLFFSIQHKEAINMEKICSGCGEIKYFNEFYKFKRSKDGVRSICKKCCVIEDKKRKEKNFEKYKEIRKKSNKKWRIKNQEYDKKRYVEKRDYLLNLNSIWQKNNPEKVKKNQKKFRKNNPEKLRENIRRDSRRRRAVKNNAKGYHTEQQWLDKKKYHGYKCFYCGILENELKYKYPEKEGNKKLEKMFWKLTEDHRKALTKRGSDWVSNIVPACWSCNSSKNNKNINEL